MYNNWGYSNYSNPYSAQAVAQPVVFAQTSPTGVVQNVSVQPTSYDYSQPLDTQSAPPAEDVAQPAVAKFDQGRASFSQGDYATALQLTDEALKTMPNDAALHEFRGLIYFAIGKYDLAAGPLYAVLSVGPGWDWTTLSGLYSNVEVYTGQLRKLEAFVKANPKSVDATFVLAYHYLTQGNNDAGADMLKKVVALAPDDKLSAQLLRQFSPASATAEAPAAATPPTPGEAAPALTNASVSGTWSARPSTTTDISLKLGDDSSFTWTVNANGKSQQLAGTWSIANNVLTMTPTGTAGPLAGTVTLQNDGRWNFRVIGSGQEDPGLTFSK
jgi:Tfp pilus assembly protein PilF